MLWRSGTGNRGVRFSPNPAPTGAAIAAARGRAAPSFPDVRAPLSGGGARGAFFAGGTMPGAGTDKTKAWVAEAGPIVVLVEPQLGDNVGAAARAMANFGLATLRLVKPRDGWPNPRAWVAASGADRILDQAQVFDTVAAAIGDCHYVLATTARAHDQAKPVVAPDAAAQAMAPRIAAGERVAVLFGRERYGLENAEISLADRIVTLPVNPAFASLNLAQAVLVIAYEWFKLTSGGVLPFVMPQKSQGAARQQLLAFFAMLERELHRVEFLRPPEKCETMLINLRNIFHRMELTSQDVQTLHGAILAIAEGRKGPARSTAPRPRCCESFWPSTARGGCRRNAGRCAASPACCAAIPPTPSAPCGTRWSMTAASPAWASSGRRRSARISLTWCRSRCARSSTSCRTTRARRRQCPAATSAPGWRSATIA